ncbi:MAG TPA: hypothetical protein VLL97_01475 [Acidobacteriota bacterium]|nr:hypothetical protein [Acidobacteriota bacterium]
MKQNASSRRTVFVNPALLRKSGFKTFGIFCVCALLAQLISVNGGMAEERYRGILVVEKDDKYALDEKQQVEIVINEDEVKSVKLRVSGANKDLTFTSCAKLKDDGSNFTEWFSLECRELKSFDHTPVMYDYFLIDAYAGISPKITPAYSMYKNLKEISDQLGREVPSRTFVIYADRKPIYEFFCYPEKIIKR